jgi:hypothetical protein
MLGRHRNPLILSSACNSYFKMMYFPQNSSCHPILSSFVIVPASVGDPNVSIRLGNGDQILLLLHGVDLVPGRLDVTHPRVSMG